MQVILVPVADRPECASALASRVQERRRIAFLMTVPSPARERGLGKGIWVLKHSLVLSFSNLVGKPL